MTSFGSNKYDFDLRMTEILIHSTTLSDKLIFILRLFNLNFTYTLTF